MANYCGVEGERALKVWLAAIIASFVSISFWLAASRASGVDEPWDAHCYWTVIYPSALALTLLLAVIFSKHVWLPGPIIMLGQIPCAMVTSESGALLAVGIIYAVLLSIPAVIMSWAARLLYRWLKQQRQR